MAKKVTAIKPLEAGGCPAGRPKLRVCAYARVSTAGKAQAGSYAAQVAYYIQKIKGNSLWEFAGIFADEAMSGTRISGREKFQEMLEECEEGNIDLVITKSITRFARNTVECIQVIRKLKALGIGIFFEKENLHTQSEKSELLVTILSSVAQGESEDISSNNRWSVARRFQEGSYIIGTPAYGYENDADGNLDIVPEEARAVRQIFECYLDGMGTYQIARQLNEEGVPTKRNAKRWQDSAVLDILENPVYEGDLLLQKTYSEHTFPFTSRRNKGERPQYLVSDDHPPLITREEAQAARDIRKYRAGILNIDGEKCQNRYPFSGHIVCGGCGSPFHRRVASLGKPCQKTLWVCKTHVKDKGSCQVKAIGEAELQGAFLTMWNKLYTNQGTVLEPYLEGLKALPLSPSEAEEKEQLEIEIQTMTEQCRILNQVVKKGYMDTALFIENHNRLVHRLAECRKRRELLLSRPRRRGEIMKTEQIIRLLEQEGCLLKEFRSDLFGIMVQKVRVSPGHDITFCLCNGLELTEEAADRGRGR